MTKTNNINENEFRNFFRDFANHSSNVEELEGKLDKSLADKTKRTAFIRFAQAHPELINSSPILRHSALNIRELNQGSFAKMRGMASKFYSTLGGRFSGEHALAKFEQLLLQSPEKLAHYLKTNKPGKFLSESEIRLLHSYLEGGLVDYHKINSCLLEVFSITDDKGSTLLHYPDRFKKALPLLETMAASKISSHRTLLLRLLNLKNSMGESPMQNLEIFDLSYAMLEKVEKKGNDRDRKALGIILTELMTHCKDPTAKIEGNYFLLRILRLNEGNKHPPLLDFDKIFTMYEQWSNSDKSFDREFVNDLIKSSHLEYSIINNEKLLYRMMNLLKLNPGPLSTTVVEVLVKAHLQGQKIPHDPQCMDQIDSYLRQYIPSRQDLGQREFEAYLSETGPEDKPVPISERSVNLLFAPLLDFPLEKVDEKDRIAYADFIVSRRGKIKSLIRSDSSIWDSYSNDDKREFLQFLFKTHCYESRYPKMNERITTWLFKTAASKSVNDRNLIKALLLEKDSNGNTFLHNPKILQLAGEFVSQEGIDLSSLQNNLGLIPGEIITLSPAWLAKAKSFAELLEKLTPEEFKVRAMKLKEEVLAAWDGLNFGYNKGEVSPVLLDIPGIGGKDVALRRNETTKKVVAEAIPAMKDEVRNALKTMLERIVDNTPFLGTPRADDKNALHVFYTMMMLNFESVSKAIQKREDPPVATIDASDSEEEKPLTPEEKKALNTAGALISIATTKLYDRCATAYQAEIGQQADIYRAAAGNLTLSRLIERGSSTALQAVIEEFNRKLFEGDVHELNQLNYAAGITIVPEQISNMTVEQAREKIMKHFSIETFIKFFNEAVPIDYIYSFLMEQTPPDFDGGYLSMINWAKEREAVLIRGTNALLDPAFAEEQLDESFKIIRSIGGYSLGKALQWDNAENQSASFALARLQAETDYNHALEASGLQPFDFPTLGADFREADLKRLEDQLRKHLANQLTTPAEATPEEKVSIDTKRKEMAESIITCINSLGATAAFFFSASRQAATVFNQAMETNGLKPFDFPPLKANIRDADLEQLEDQLKEHLAKQLPLSKEATPQERMAIATKRRKMAEFTIAYMNTLGTAAKLHQLMTNKKFVTREQCRAVILAHDTYLQGIREIVDELEDKAEESAIDASFDFSQSELPSQTYERKRQTTYNEKWIGSAARSTLRTLESIGAVEAARVNTA